MFLCNVVLCRLAYCIVFRTVTYVIFLFIIIMAMQRRFIDLHSLDYMYIVYITFILEYVQYVSFLLFSMFSAVVLCS